MNRLREMKIYCCKILELIFVFVGVIGRKEQGVTALYMEFVFRVVMTLACLVIFAGNLTCIS